MSHGQTDALLQQIATNCQLNLIIFLAVKTVDKCSKLWSKIYWQVCSQQQWVLYIYNTYIAK